ncbi:MAG: hypothetical protein MJE68_10620 [Proteobacteria bacterium]|nr:hypothetical protein [Pseudomonadota bacterium]
MIMPRILVHFILDTPYQISSPFINRSMGVSDFFILVGSDKLSSDKLRAEGSKIVLDCKAKISRVASENFIFNRSCSHYTIYDQLAGADRSSRTRRLLTFADACIF